MKKLILLFLLPLLSIKGFGQAEVLDTLIGKNASYYLINYDEFYLMARNIHNTDTSRTMYYDNGKKVPWEWDLKGEMKCNWEELFQTIESALTEKEWETLKNTTGGLLMIWIVADKAGEPLEIDFTFKKDDPVFTKMNADRLFVLEEKLKKILKLKVAEADKNIKRMKYFVSFLYRDIDSLR